MALAFLSLPFFGAISILVLAFFLDPPVEPYEQVSERVQRLEWRDRYALAQMFLAHADGLGVGPVEAHSCVKEIADGNDLSICRPSSADRISASVLLLDHMIAALDQHRGLRQPAGSDPGDLPGTWEEDGAVEADENYDSADEGDGCPAWDGPDGEEIAGSRGDAIEI